MLLGLLFFHWMGYQALYGWWMQQANTEMESRLDKSEFEVQELVTIAIPLHLPYLTDQAEYERLSGEIIFNGIPYQYVQRRVYHDSLYLQCLPNYTAMRLNTARSDCFKFTTDIQQNSSGVSKVSHTFIKHFTGGGAAFSAQQRVVYPKLIFFPIHQTILHEAVSAGPDQPPEAAV